MFERVAVVGLGLIGGSLLTRLRAAGVDVRGYDREPATRKLAHARESLADAVADADLVVLAVPLSTLDPVLAELSMMELPGLLTDVTSVKAPVATMVRERLPGVRFVGGHPMAGAHTSGFTAADPHLFDDCAWVLCLEEDTDLDDWRVLATFLCGLGTRVVPTTARAHDDAVARISHAPHVLAAALAATAAVGDVGPLALALGAGSFRDGTRVAATRPELVAAMCGGNATAVAAHLDVLIGELTRARAALTGDDPVTVFAEWMRPGHEVRAAWPASGQDESTATADRDELLAVGRGGGWLTSIKGTTFTAAKSSGEGSK